MIVDNPYIKDLHDAIRSGNQEKAKELEEKSRVFLIDLLERTKTNVEKVKDQANQLKMQTVKKGFQRGELRKIYNESIDLNRYARDVVKQTVELKAVCRDLMKK